MDGLRLRGPDSYASVMTISRATPVRCPTKKADALTMCAWLIRTLAFYMHQGHPLEWHEPAGQGKQGRVTRLAADDQLHRAGP